MMTRTKRDQRFRLLFLPGVGLRLIFQETLALPLSSILTLPRLPQLSRWGQFARH